MAYEATQICESDPTERRRRRNLRRLQRLKGLHNAACEMSLKSKIRRCPCKRSFARCIRAGWRPAVALKKKTRQRGGPSSGRKRSDKERPVNLRDSRDSAKIIEPPGSAFSNAIFQAAASELTPRRYPKNKGAAQLQDQTRYVLLETLKLFRAYWSCE
jgi:hypothetical protein